MEAVILALEGFLHTVKKLRYVKQKIPLLSDWIDKNE
jgi:hypothetical protein